MPRLPFWIVNPPAMVDVADTYKLVVVTFVVLILEGLKLVAAKVVKDALVDVIEVAKKRVEVMAVPEAEVKYNGPVSVPPAKGK